jgi:hypothetical protein
MKKLWWFPYRSNFAPMSAFAEMVHGPGLHRRIVAAIRSLPLMFRKRS